MNVNCGDHGAAMVALNRSDGQVNAARLANSGVASDDLIGTTRAAEEAQ